MSQSTNCALKDHIRCQSPIQCDCICHKPSPNTNIDDLMDTFLAEAWNCGANHQPYDATTAKTQLEALLSVAKIEELKWCLDDGSGPPSPFDIEERIKELEKK